MMEIIKRHLFLAGLVGGVVVISLAVALTAYFFYMGPNARTEATLKSTLSQAKALEQGKLFSEELIKQMAGHVDSRKTQHEELLAYIKGLGAARKPLVENLFPTSTDINLRHSFKTAYDAAIASFVKRLGAGKPMLPVRKGSKGKTEADSLAIAAAKEAYRKFTLFAHPTQSFERPLWVEHEDAPSLDLVRAAQEDIWLMEDIVEIIAQVNADVLKAKQAADKTIQPVVAHAPVKELAELRVGSPGATLPNSQMQSSAGERYRPVSEAAGPAAQAGRAPTLSGRYSKSGFFLVLPWRLTVVVESQYAGELIRRLKGRETFLTVEAWRMKPITDVSFDRMRTLMVDSRDDYGRDGIALLEVVGESMVFQLPGGRVTTLAAAAQPPAGEAAETATSGE